jgi:homoserine dehydrogenase
MIPPASTPEATEALPMVADVESSFYLHLEVADRPGVLAQICELLGPAGRVGEVRGPEGTRGRTPGS